MQEMSSEEVKMYVVNGSAIMLDEQLVSETIHAVSVNNRQLIITAYRPTSDDEVRSYCSSHPTPFQLNSTQQEITDAGVQHLQDCI